MKIRSSISGNRNKRMETSSDDSFKRRRSSLQVNLSCSLNLTDSGNDSLEQCLDNTALYGIPLKNLSIVLERLSKPNINERTNKANARQDRARRRQSSLKKHSNNVNCTAESIHSKEISNCIESNLIQLETNEIPCSSNSTSNHSLIYRKRSLSVSSISESITAFAERPICSSTMIEDDKKSDKGQTLYENPIVELNHNVIEPVETNSSNTLQTSLNVNTSIDVINENSKNRNCKIKKNMHSIVLDATEENSIKEKSMHSVTLDETGESVSTIATSLQMNTSLGILNKLQRKGKTLNCSIIENPSLNKKKDVHNNFDNQKSKNNRVQDEELNCTCNGNTSNSIILHKSSHEMLHTKSQASVLIDESTDKSEAENGQSMQHFVEHPDKRKCKRKLLPLRECSQLISFSPVQKEYSPPPCLVLRKKYKKKRKQGKKNDERVNISKIEHIEHVKDTKDHDKEKQKKPRKVISKKIVVKKIVNEDILNKLRLENDKENCNNVEMIEVYNSQRNSLNDFQPLRRSVVQITKKKQKRLNIVTTGLSNEDKDLVKRVIKSLGCARLESKVSKNTTHVVTTGVRTINLLHGIIRGCWMVSLEWILKSLESNTWLNPEKYEMTHFSKAVLENRKDRQLFGKAYIPELFITCGNIYVETNTSPPCNILKDLIKTAGGCITEDPGTAKISIGAEGLKESWIFDCITTGELQPYNQYHRI